MTRLSEGLATLMTSQEAMVHQTTQPEQPPNTNTEGATFTTPTVGSTTPGVVVTGSNHLAIVRNGEFVDFIELLPVFKESSAEFSYKKSKEKAPKRCINFLNWLQAWSTYERLVMKLC